MKLTQIWRAHRSSGDVIHRGHGPYGLFGWVVSDSVDRQDG